MSIGMDDRGLPYFIDDGGRHAPRRTPEAQADIAAARAAPTAMEVAMQELDHQVERALEDAKTGGPTAYRAPLPANVAAADLDAALSDAAIADMPAVREMGQPKLTIEERCSLPGTAKALPEDRARALFQEHRRRTPEAQMGGTARKRGARKERSRVRIVVSSPGSEANALVDMVAALLGDNAGLELDEVEVTDELLRSLEGKWTDPDTFTTCLNGQEVRLRRPASIPIRGETPPLPPDAIVLTGPEAERYRAIAAAARKAQQSATTARADGAALLQLFQAFCAGLAPGDKP